METSPSLRLWGESLVLSRLDNKRLLCIGAHPDDIELGCGATIASLSPTNEIFCHVLSNNSEFPGLGTSLNEAAENSFSRLGIKSEKIIRSDFRTRYFSEDRQAIADEFIRVRTEVRPDIVICHSGHDLHQDHGVVYNEAIRIFRLNILLFEIVRSSNGFQPSVYIPVSEEEARQKVEALQLYNDLYDKDYLTADTQWSHLRLRGLDCNATYAEGFESFRLVMAD